MAEMLWKTIVVLLSVLSAGNTINKPVYKIILTQKGFAQFVQYDVEIPPMREFTFCTWIRVNNLDEDQSIFTYVVNGNSRVVRLWLDSGGRYMRVTINDKVSSSVPVDITQDVWRHVCLSYQSDFGAWALYIDSRLASCEASQSLYGFVIPGSGSIIIGYGRTENDSGSPKGLEGEVFGANMILASTIDRNYTIKTDPEYEQKTFKRNKIRNNNDIEYIVLRDLQTDEIHNNVGNTLLPPFVNTTKSYVKVKTPYSFVEHHVGKIMRPRKAMQVDTSSDKEILDVVVNEHTEDSDNRINFWNLVNDAGRAGKFKVLPKNNKELSSSSTRDLPVLAEYELPPPQGTSNQYYMEKNLELEKPPITESIYNTKNEESNKSTKSVFNKRHMKDIAEIETPPPPQDDQKVYGQWTSSRFAGSVLNYLKSINFHSKEKKVPATIPLTKYSASFPYATDFRMNMFKSNVPLKRKNVIIEKSKYNQNTYLAQSPLKRLQLQKRNAKQPQINVQIVQDDTRTDILRSHAKTKPKHVEVTVRGRPKKLMEHRFYRNVDSQGSFEIFSDTNTVPRGRPAFNTATDLKNHKMWNKFDIHKSNSLLTALPFLKSVEYFTEESGNFDSEKMTESSDMYSKSLSYANKWHNVKSYNNDYTPRRINMTQEFGKSDMDINISELNKKHPSIRLKYKSETDKLVKNYDDTNIIKGRELAMGVSNQSDYNKDSISILKYNHGFLPGHDEKRKMPNKQNLEMQIKPKYSKVNGKHNFNKQVKIGNALNEQHVIGVNEEQKKKSFVGGNERIPDIHRYRSDIDNEIGNVPSSIKPRACRNVELFDHILYVKPDESIDMSEILSPIKRKNVGMEFIMLNYKRCALEDSPFVKSDLLLLHWSRTPVRLFGGAYPKKTTDLCGFF